MCPLTPTPKLAYHASKLQKSYKGGLMLRLLALVAVLCSCLLAQTTGTATIVGTLTDSTGARVAGAKITVVNIETSFTFNGVSSAEGEYFVPYRSEEHTSELQSRLHLVCR